MMNARARTEPGMPSRFADIISKTGDRLRLPLPARTRILLEIHADLEDLYEYFRTQGMSDTDAHEEALRRFDLSDAALIALLIGSLGWWLQALAITHRVAGASVSVSDVAAGLAAGAATAVIAMTGALTCCLIWTLLAHKVAAVERAEAEVLLESG